MKRILLVSVVVVCGCVLMSGCATQPAGLSQAQQGTAIGAATGAGLGAVVGKNMSHGAGGRDKGALIGAVAGSALGYVIGQGRDVSSQQQAQIQQIQAQQNSTVIWITNSNGSRTAVVLHPATGGQWIGPRGEYYTGLPTPEMLKSYGF